jgi:hypothetical protein
MARTGAVVALLALALLLVAASAGKAHAALLIYCHQELNILLPPFIFIYHPLVNF